MQTNGSTTQQLVELVEALRSDLKTLNERVAALEKSATAKVNGAPTGPAPVSEEVLAVLSAAIAAYLGCTPKIRQIRLVGNAGWAQQGRVTIQASHNLIQ